MASAIGMFMTLVLVMYGSDGLLSGPRGVHYIRQTDSLSFIAYFREYSANLFTPGVMDLRNAPDDGRCAGEFPLVYWCIAMIERLAGPLPLLLKWVNLTSVLIGHIFLVRALFKVFKDELLALGTGLLLFSSGVVAYYACNYLPDALAYGLILMGWSLVLPGMFSGGVPRSCWTTMLFVLAGLIKAPMAMHLLIWVIISNTYRQRIGFDPKKEALRSLGLLCTVASWHLYARWYNAEHGSHYFLTSAAPFWGLTAEEFHNIHDLVLHYWWSKYLHPSTWHILALLSIIALFRFRQLSKPVRICLASLIIATAGFLVLFYRKLADHDYYFLTVMPLVIWLFTAGLWSLFPVMSTRWGRIGITSLIWVLALSAANLARIEVDRRMSNWPDRYAGTATATQGVAKMIEALDLPTDSRIVVVGDSTTNGALLSVGRLGWSFPGYPVNGYPNWVSLKTDGASHVLYLGKCVEDVPPPEIGPIVATGHTWTLRAINR